MPGNKAVKMSELTPVSDEREPERFGSGLHEYCESGTNKKILVLVKEYSRDQVGDLFARLYTRNIHDITRKGLFWRQSKQLRLVQHSEGDTLKVCEPLYSGPRLDDMREKFCTNDEDKLAGLIQFVKDHKISEVNAGEILLDKVLGDGNNIDFCDFALSPQYSQKTLNVVELYDSEALEALDPNGVDYEEMYKGIPQLDLLSLNDGEVPAQESTDPLHPWGRLHAIAKEPTDDIFRLFKEGGISMDIKYPKNILKVICSEIDKVQTHVIAAEKVLADMRAAGYDTKQWCQGLEESVINSVVRCVFFKLQMARTHIECLLPEMKYEDASVNKEFSDGHWIFALTHPAGILGYAHINGMKISGYKPQERIRERCVEESMNFPVLGYSVHAHFLLWIRYFIPRYSCDARYLQLRVSITESLELLERNNCLPFGIEKEVWLSVFEQSKEKNVVDVIDNFCAVNNNYYPWSQCLKTYKRIITGLKNTPSLGDLYHSEARVEQSKEAGDKKAQNDDTPTVSPVTRHVVVESPSLEPTQSKETDNKEAQQHGDIPVPAKERTAVFSSPPSSELEQHSSRGNLWTVCFGGGCCMRGGRGGN